MAGRDAFADLARYYDAIMATVDYDRWLLVTMALVDLLPERQFRHLDVACGTGLLSRQLRRHGWNTIGVDLSPAMARKASTGERAAPVAVADMRTLPFRGNFDYVTCLFDSLNFVLEEEGVHAALQSMAHTLSDEGLLYFDVITSRMVTEYFEDQTWTETNGKFTTAWSSTFDHTTGITETAIRVNSGEACFVKERVYPLNAILEAVESSGLRVLGAYDAENWEAPGRKTIRVDVVAAKEDSRALRKRLEKVETQVKGLLR